MPYCLASVTHLVHQFLLLAVDADLVEQVADLAARPQLLDEVLAGRRFGLRREVHLVDELLLLLADLPVSLIAGVPVPGVAADHDELRAVEQVGQLRRVDLVDAGCRRRSSSFRSVSTGWLILPYRLRDLRLDVLGRADVGADGPRVSASWSSIAAFTSSPTPKVKMRVLAGVLGGHVLHDLVRVGLADGRLAVGEEHDGERPARVARPHARAPRPGPARWRCRRWPSGRRPTCSRASR